jgi:DNA helicase-2/ATP-dependent DNA helicase PcrA
LTPVATGRADVRRSRNKLLPYNAPTPLSPVVYSSQILGGLNPQQLAAVTLPNESALILAGAGSGKTRVLTTRIAWLIQTGQVGPGGVLAVTFTNKAAREMLTRISAMLPINTRGMWVGTFHGLCNRLLRAHHRDARLPQTFQILDSQDQLALIKRLLKSLNVDEEKCPARDLQYFVNGNKEEGLRAGQVQAFDEHSRRLTELYAEYEKLCDREAAVDFAELLLRCFELLSRNEVLRRHYQRRFTHILVDEFQDTNRLQYRWLTLLAGTHNAIFAVGDDDQSIYAFRGASANNMFDFERDFAKGKVIKLEQNYRSHGNILDAANALIRHNRNRLGKELWTAEAKGAPLCLFEAGTDIEEAAYIVDEIRGLRGEGVRPSDIALLYRSNAQSRVLEHALFNAALPYRVYGGLRFFERQEIKHALAYLRLVASPDDDGALLRVINLPARGVGSRSLEQLQDSARMRGVSLWHAVCSTPLAGKAGSGVAAFVALIQNLRRDCLGLALREIVEVVIDRSGLTAYYETEKDGQDRIENLNELVTAAAGFEAEGGFAPPAEASAEGAGPAEEAIDPRFRMLSDFLAHASLEAGEHQAGAGADALQLMTAHAAKGLEFHAVFVSGLEEGLFPHENSLNDPAGLEEERRLMYVALTRARRRLYLSFAQSRMLHGQTRYNIASRFLEEIPAELVRRVNTVRAVGFGLPASAPAGSAAALSSEPPPAAPWKVGQNVLHAKFGPGVIVNAEGRGADARVQVNFRNAGLKWLALEYAKLTPA